MNDPNQNARLSSPQKDEVALMIIHELDNHTMKMEKIYIKKADIQEIMKTAFKENPYLNGIKWFFRAILIAFGGTAIALVFNAYVKFTS